MKNKAILRADGSLITSEVRLLFNHLENPVKGDDGKAQYSACLLISNKDTQLIEMLREKIEGLAKEKFGAAFKPTSMRFYPLRDGNEKENDIFNDAVFINVKSYRKPPLLSLDGSSIDGTGQLYGGCYGRALLTFYTYDRNGNKGVATSIAGFQKTRDGEPMGQTVDAVDAFAENPFEEAPLSSAPF